MKQLESNILSIYKDKGRAWLDHLPHFLKHSEKMLSIKIAQPYKNLSFHYVAPATGSNGTAWVFKCGLPNKEFTSQVHALQHYQGHGAIQLIDADAEAGWMLLERCIPGTTLNTIKNESKAISIAIEVLQRLWRPTDQSPLFPTLENWFKKLIPHERIPNVLMDYAKKTSKELLDSQGEPVLLHGDFHKENVLASQREPWLAIDPKGVIGEREFDLVGTVLQTLDPKALSSKIIQRRLDQINEHACLDKQRIVSWITTKCVLGACWSIEDNTQGTENFIALANLFYSLR